MSAICLKFMTFALALRAARPYKKGFVAHTVAMLHAMNICGI